MVHCEFATPVQVSPAVQLPMAVQVAQARSLAVVQAVLSYEPAAQAPAQAAQVSAVPSTRCVPEVQAMH